MFDVRKLQTNDPIKRGNLSGGKKEKLPAHSPAAEVHRAPQRHCHFSITLTSNREKTSAPEDAAFKQLHVLHEEHPQSSVRAGEVGLHHRKFTPAKSSF